VLGLGPGENSMISTCGQSCRTRFPKVNGDWGNSGNWGTKKPKIGIAILQDHGVQWVFKVGGQVPPFNSKFFSG